MSRLDDFQSVFDELEQHLREETKVKCPQCNSTNVTTYGKKFSKGAALVVALAIGPIGLIAGSTNKAEFICLDCGKKWRR